MSKFKFLELVFDDEEDELERKEIWENDRNKWDIIIFHPLVSLSSYGSIEMSP